jgi:hypothetical protein
LELQVEIPSRLVYRKHCGYAKERRRLVDSDDTCHMRRRLGRGNREEGKASVAVAKVQTGEMCKMRQREANRRNALAKENSTVDGKEVAHQALIILRRPNKSAGLPQA